MNKKFYQFGHKMQSKTWDPSEIDAEKEGKKIGWMFIVIILLFVGLFVFEMWLKTTLH